MDNLDGISCEWGGAVRIIVSFGLLSGEEPFILAAEGQNERFLSGRNLRIRRPGVFVRLLIRNRLLRQGSLAAAVSFRACDVAVWRA